jgi:hypothetical protein
MYSIVRSSFVLSHDVLLGDGVAEAVMAIAERLAIQAGFKIEMSRVNPSGPKLARSWDELVSDDINPSCPVLSDPRWELLAPTGKTRHLLALEWSIAESIVRVRGNELTAGILFPRIVFLMRGNRFPQPLIHDSMASVEKDIEAWFGVDPSKRFPFFSNFGPVCICGGNQ